MSKYLASLLIVGATLLGIGLGAVAMWAWFFVSMLNAIR